MNFSMKTTKLERALQLISTIELSSTWACRCANNHEKYVVNTHESLKQFHTLFLLKNQRFIEQMKGYTTDNTKNPAHIKRSQP